MKKKKAEKGKYVWKIKTYKFKTGFWGMDSWKENVALKNGWRAELDKKRKIAFLFTPNDAANFAMSFDTLKLLNKKVFKKR